MSDIPSSSIPNVLAGAPTEEARTFLDSLEPAVQFVAPKEDPVGIPKGLLTCCRVTHQPDCQFYVATSLVGAATVRQFPDGTRQEWVHPTPIAFPGDILTQPTKMFAAVKAHWMMARETAKRLDAVVIEMTIGIFLLDAQQSLDYQGIQERVKAKVIDTIAGYETLTPEQIEALPIKDLDDPEDIQVTMLKREFRPVETYAAKVLLVPNEIGHDDEFRYLDNAVWDAPEQEAIPWQPDPEPKVTRPVLDLDAL